MLLQVFRYDMLAASTVKDYHRKLLDFLPERFDGVIDELRRVLASLNMYCLSFCPPHVIAESRTKRQNKHLETALHYALRRKDFARTIEMHIRNIETMAGAYRSQAGVSVKAFGLSTNELARRCDCGDIPFLLIFPEACFNVHFACAAIRKWIEADRDYDEFVRHDVARLEQVKLEQSKVVQEQRVKLGGVEYRLKATRRAIDDLEVEMANMSKSEEKVLALIEKLETDIKVMDIELAYQEKQRNKLKRDAHKLNISEADLVEKLNDISKVVAKIRRDRPETTHQISAVKNKQKVVIEKRESLNARVDELKELERQKLLTRGYLHEARRQYDALDAALTTLKDIYMKKTSPDLTKKIYNNMPVQPRHPRHVTTSRQVPVALQTKGIRRRA